MTTRSTDTLRSEVAAHYPSLLDAFDELATLSEQRRASQPEHLRPCPPWCRYRELFGDDHGYDSITADGTLSRYHVSGQDVGHVAQLEEFRNGVVTLGPVTVSAYDVDGPLSAVEARELAAALLAGAERIEGLGSRGAQR